MNNNFKIGDNIYFENIDTGLASGTIVDICEYKNISTNKIDKMFMVHDNTNLGTIGVKTDKIWKTKDEAKTAIKLEHERVVKAYKDEISDINALIKFMYDNNVSTAEEYTDWDARQAARERTKELLDLDL